MKKATKEMGDHAERRSSARLNVELWVEQATDRELYFQRSANISEGGIFLEHTIAHPRGTEISLCFHLPEDTDAIVVKGEIVSVGAVGSELGMGIKFLDLTSKDRQRIQKFVSQAVLEEPR